ncbi:RuvX/YqgF family protein [Neomicrococcus aestuarii]|uniref:Putative pre-16S rRNA nuclease n=1 Tax=Neomicrococcus aestuarii TaxID=556325 RepID=A0A1L2ZLH1_9MICC|nr:RuvX/YqgF family protein [Neomicrococcus aestuarii]APF40049.1 hypothetical protein BHE16_02345 [Neomicrococcus aestuarii]
MTESSMGLPEVHILRANVRAPRAGVDVGQARVGVAFSDPDGLLASPWKTLKRNASSNQDVRLLARELKARNVCRVYVGLPRSLKGNDTASTEMAWEYADILNNLLNSPSSDLAAPHDPQAGSPTPASDVVIPVFMIDERLSTVSAHKTLRENGIDSRKHRAIIDQAAAVNILQQALEMESAQQRIPGDFVPFPESAPGLPEAPEAKDPSL